MANDSRFPLSASEARALWKRLLDGDPTATSDVAVAYLDPLVDWLVQRYPRCDPHDCATAAEDTILALIRNPSSYQPERQTLEAYLRMAASRDLQNLWQREKRHAKRRARLEAVELSPQMRKYLRDDDADPAAIVDREEDLAQDRDRTRRRSDEILRGLAPLEVHVFELMRSGERRTEAYARALGLSDRPLDEQRREVKRVKDRIKKRIERAGDLHV